MSSYPRVRRRNPPNQRVPHTPIRTSTTSPSIPASSTCGPIINMLNYQGSCTLLPESQTRLLVTCPNLNATCVSLAKTALGFTFDLEILCMQTNDCALETFPVANCSTKYGVEVFALDRSYECLGAVVGSGSWCAIHRGTRCLAY